MSLDIFLAFIEKKNYKQTSTAFPLNTNNIIRILK